MKFDEDVKRKYENMLSDLNESEDSYDTIARNTNDRFQELTQIKQTKQNKNELEACKNGIEICDNNLGEIHTKKDLVREFLSDLYQL